MREKLNMKEISSRIIKMDMEVNTTMIIQDMKDTLLTGLKKISIIEDVLLKHLI